MADNYIRITKNKIPSLQSVLIELEEAEIELKENDLVFVKHHITNAKKDLIAYMEKIKWE